MSDRTDITGTVTDIDGKPNLVLTRTFQEAKVPGAKGPRTALGRFDFYTLDLT